MTAKLPTMWSIALSSLRHYWRSNLVVAIGVAIATAVLTGALIVGDSMRGSLRELTLDRLGAIDEILISDGFFRQALAAELASQLEFSDDYSKAVPVILFPNGSVETSGTKSVQRAAQVTVLGVPQEFWSLGVETIRPSKELSGRDVAINATLAMDLGITADDVSRNQATVTVRIPKPTQLPADSTLGQKQDLVAALVDLTVIQIVPTQSLGRFSLHPSQSDPRNIYLPIELIADELARETLSHKSDPRQCNAMLLAGVRTDQPPPPEAGQGLLAAMRPSLEDHGLTLKRARQEFEADVQSQEIFDYWSLASDRMVLPQAVVPTIQSAFPDAKPVFTYLANDMALSDQSSGVPFSMVASIDIDERFPLVAVDGSPIAPLDDNEIVLNEWAAKDLEATVGDIIRMTYFEPETTHGNEVEQTSDFTVTAIAKLTEPATPFRIRRRGPIDPPTYDRPPTLANDPDLTPQVAGVTDAESIERWELPFATADKIRPQDDDYWNYYRTTPKGFVSLATGQRLWGSRFGDVTSFRIQAAERSRADVENSLLAEMVRSGNQLGFQLIPIKRTGLAASSGSTPFDVLFLALSMFVIAAALILVSLLFRLTLAARSDELGVMLATGFRPVRVTRLGVREMLVVAIVGAVLGALLGVAYAALMTYGLRTWWAGAISPDTKTTPFLRMYVTPLSLGIGIMVGVITCVWTIRSSVRRASRLPARQLLSQQIESSASAGKRSGRLLKVLIVLFIVAAVGLAILATQLGGEPQAGAFLSAGFLVLAAGLMLTYARLSSGASGGDRIGLARIATLNGRRSPLRSTLTIGLVAVASFLILAVSSFRLTPTRQGTAGFDFVARSNQPVFEDLTTPEGLQAVTGNQVVRPGALIYSFRYKAGEDASCTNLYQSTQPQVLGMPQSLIDRFDDPDVDSFMWGGSTGQTPGERQNPWRLLNRPVLDGAIPVVIDKNTANYSLKIFAPGGQYRVSYDSGEEIVFQVVGFLANSVLQGSLIVSEENFVDAFPDVGGYRYFLIKQGEAGAPNQMASDYVTIDRALESQLSDQGFDAQSASRLLDEFMLVQNTYISTFQALGALGLLLGTFGLAAVQVRSVIERRGELGLMRAVGFRLSQLSRMVVIENAWLLLIGMAIGIGAALFTTLPHFIVGGASVPWLDLTVMFAGILLAGLGAAWLASQVIGRMPLIDSLRS